MNFLNKYLTIAIYVLIALTMINGCNSCASKKESQHLRKDVDSLTIVVKDLRANTYDKKELDVRMSIEGYEVSKRMLYDNNVVVRTTQRPDDIMVGYDAKIKELRSKLHE